jgi:hypothetical protein
MIRTLQLDATFPYKQPPKIESALIVNTLPKIQRPHPTHKRSAKHHTPAPEAERSPPGYQSSSR